MATELNPGKDGMSVFARKGEDQRPPDPNKIDTIIGTASSVEGALAGHGSLRVDGSVSGTIEYAGDVMVGEEADVVAEIKARNVTIAGKVKGNIRCEGRLSLASSAHLTGDVNVGELLIEAGAHYRGKSNMGTAAEAEQGGDDSVSSGTTGQ